MKKKKSKEWIWIEDGYHVWPSEDDSYLCFTIYADQESICELSYKELLMIRDMINRIEQRHSREKGGDA